MFPIVEQDLRKVFSPVIVNNCALLGIQSSCELLEHARFPNNRFKKIFGESSRAEIYMKFLTFGISIDHSKRFEHVLVSMPLLNN